MMFQSTRPVWGATQTPTWLRTSESAVSIHAPRAGRDRSLVRRSACLEHVSIHAPRAGRDIAML